MGGVTPARALAFLLGLGLAGPAAANCDDLWFTRNLIMDRAGYCFGSALGRAVFDNADCTGKSVTLSAGDQALVERLRVAERDQQCRVDTTRREIDLDDRHIRPRLVDLPVAVPDGSACMNWLSARIAVHAGRNRATPVLGHIEPGDNVNAHHQDENGWSYVQIYRPENPEADEPWAGPTRFVAAGWLPLHWGAVSCTIAAG